MCFHIYFSKQAKKSSIDADGNDEDVDDGEDKAEEQFLSLDDIKESNNPDIVDDCEDGEVCSNIQLVFISLSVSKKKFSYCDRKIVIVVTVIVVVQNFDVTHYSKSIKGINTKLGILAQHDKIQLQLARQGA